MSEWDNRIEAAKADAEFIKWLKRYNPDYELECEGYMLGMHDSWEASRTPKHLMDGRVYVTIEVDQVSLTYDGSIIFDTWIPKPEGAKITAMIQRADLAQQYNEMIRAKIDPRKKK